MMKCFHIISSRTKRTGETSSEIRGQNPSTEPPRTLSELCRDKEQKLRKFSFSELKKATNNFNRSLKIGEGGVGSVYKGSVKPPGGKGGPVVVAIKLFKEVVDERHKEWLAEVQFLGVVEHPNLVKLLGYSSTDGERRPWVRRLLVYEYMPNKSLESHIFSRTSPPIPWRKRLQILLGAAQGLLYLHEGLETQVIFRDFKSANVLLDENFDPKLSDWVLERKGPEYRWKRFEVRHETYAYVAPEHMASGRTTSKCDVWSFGVVLYEILSGRKAVGVNLPEYEKSFINWVKEFPVNSTRFWMIMDPRLNHQYSHRAARKVAKLADSCLKKHQKDRPTMSQVVDALQEAIRVSEDDLRSPLPESSTRRLFHVG